MEKLLALLLFCVASHAFAVSNAGRIPVLGYHTHISMECDYGNNTIKTLEADLETIYSRGYTVIPALWAAEWAAGERDGATLPDKPIVITLDDGSDQDFRDSQLCGYLPSAYTVLANFWKKHPDLPYPPQATVFVIASPTARSMIFPFGLPARDDWWKKAQESGLFVIGNHSADHDHWTIRAKYWDPDLGTYLRVGSIADNSWNRPSFDFTRINSYETADAEVRKAALFIKSKTGVYPKLFAYPYGQASDYMRTEYFPKNPEHGTYAAFCTTPDAVTRKSDRWCLPRFLAGWWYTPEQFIANVLQEPLNIPTISGMSPSTIRAGETGLNIHLYGENFLPGSAVVVVSSPAAMILTIPVTFNNAGDISFVSGTFVNGTYMYHVRNPDGMVSPDAVLMVH